MNQYCQQVGRGLAFPVSGQSIDLPVSTPTVCLAVRERALLEKEQRAQLQYERSLVERGRRLEEQRQKEMLRRSAVEEKRKQCMEEEKVRGYSQTLFSLGYALKGQIKYFFSYTFLSVNSFIFGFVLNLNNKGLCSRIASSSPHRSPYRASPSRAERKKVSTSFYGQLDDSSAATTPKSPQFILTILILSSFTMKLCQWDLNHVTWTKCLLSCVSESPVTPTGKAGTSDAEEASRLLAERRRLARVQKEQEEKQRLEEERLRAEELQRQQEEERQRQEQAAREAEEKRQRQEEERCQRELEDRHQKEQRNTAIISPPKAKSEYPIICLEPLEAKSCGADDLSDGVQSMDVSPVSRDELVPEYSPISEISQNSMTSVALGDIHILTGQVSHPKVSAAPAFGDCNKNLIQDCSSAAIDSSLFQSLRQVSDSSDKLNI
uniref:MAP7 domain containing 2b n=1 Tax=Sinocyclocheilus rhinocerous TaxID=307959 RepID=A0A673IJ18_9TELE